MFTEILKQLCNNEAIQSLLKADNQVESIDPETLIFKDDDSELKVKITDNSLSFSFNSIKKPDTTREDFIKFCDTLDDEFFEEMCEMYTAANGDGSLNELNKNLTKEGIKEFYNYGVQIATQNINKFKNYKSKLINTINGL